MVWSSRAVGTSRSPDTQAFSIGQDRESRTQGPFGADEHDPAGRMESGQGGRRFPSCLDSDGNCPRHRGTPGMAVHTREARLCRHQRQRRVPEDGWSGKPILGHPSRAGASRHQKAPSSMFRDKVTRQGPLRGAHSREDGLSFLWAWLCPARPQFSREDDGGRPPSLAGTLGTKGPLKPARRSVCRGPAPGPSLSCWGPRWGSRTVRATATAGKTQHCLTRAAW